MKQEMISYLHTIKDDIFKLSRTLYENPEESFNEYKSYEYIVNMLKSNNFKITENYLQIPTAFYAEYGSGHPKICFICEYDAATKDGHITGHNLISAISIGASLALAKVLNKLNSGTIIVLGCPGEFINGAKVTMAKQGTFSDVDAVLMVHPDVENALTGTSMAVLPMKIKYTSKEPLVNSKEGAYSSLDACNFTYNFINCLKTGFKNNCTVDGVTIKNSSSSHLIPTEHEIKFYIRAPKMVEACEIEGKIKELVKAVGSLMELQYEMSIPELPYDELIPNQALSRLYAHNLKEIGIIDAMHPKNSFAGLSLGTVSHIVPCLHSYISITEDKTIKYSTQDFAKATVSDFANEQVLKAATALATLALDLLEKEQLVLEVKSEFYENIKSHQNVSCDL